MRGSKPAGSASDFCEGIGKKLQAEFCDHYLRGCGALVTIMILRKQGGGGQAGGQVVAQFPTHTNAVGGPPAAPRSPPPSAAGCALGARRRGTGV